MSTWVQFFKDAGIPSSAAKSYATVFEDNRISKDMLLDLSKEILTDMGIRVMGDIISILKHAKRVHAQEARKKEWSGGSSSAAAPGKVSASTSSPSQTATVSTTSSARRAKPLKPAALHTVSVSEAPADSWTQEVSAGAGEPPISPETIYVTYQEAEPGAVLVAPARLQPMEVEQPSLEYPTLRSDQLLLEAQAQGILPEMEEYLQEAPQIPLATAAVGSLEEEFLDGYTTAAYELNQRKRPLGLLYSDVVGEYDLGASPPKQPRVVLVPGEGQEAYSSQTSVVGRALKDTSSSAERSRRMLEAAGLYPAQKLSKERVVTGSVFSRLGSAAEPTPLVTPSGSKEALTVTTTRTVVDPSKPRAVRLSSTPTEKVKSRTLVSTSGLASSSSSSSSRPAAVGRASSKLSIKERLGIREKGDRFEKGERLGVREKGERLTLREKAERRDIPRSKSAVTVSRKITKPSMVADEYETTRQLDIRSRLEQREKEKRARRQGPLAGRLGQHKVFERLE